MKRKGVLRVEGKLDPKQAGENIEKIYPGFFGMAKMFFNSKEGMAEFIEWLRSLPEEGPYSECRAELPMWEARLKEMEVA